MFPFVRLRTVRPDFRFDQGTKTLPGREERHDLRSVDSPPSSMANASLAITWGRVGFMRQV